jgi:hypothetical protein
MTELWMWEMQPGKSLLHPATRKERLNCFMSRGTLTLGVQDHLYHETGCSATARTDVPHFYENQRAHWCSS